VPESRRFCAQLARSSAASPRAWAAISVSQVSSGGFAVASSGGAVAIVCAAIVLIALATRHSDGVTLTLPVTRELLGAVIGSRRATVSFALKALEQQRLLVCRDDGTWVLPRRRDPVADARHPGMRADGGRRDRHTTTRRGRPSHGRVVSRRSRARDRGRVHVGQIDRPTAELDPADHAAVVKLVILGTAVERRCKADPLHGSSVAQRQPHEHAPDPSPVQQLSQHHAEVPQPLRGAHRVD
jgi:hypothetical protein